MNTVKDHRRYIPTIVPSLEDIATDRLEIASNKERLESKVKALLSEGQVLGKKCLQNFWDIGETLIELKKGVPHGSWEGCVKSLGMEPRTANNYCKLVKGFVTMTALENRLKSENISEVGLVKALALLKSDATGSSGGDEKPKSPAVTLVDGSSLPLSKLGWTEGIISFDSLQATIDLCQRGEDEEPQPNKSMGQVQRAVSWIAAGVNNAVGKSTNREAKEVILEALDLVKTAVESGS